MALEVTAKGTLRELEQLWPWDKLCVAVHVDFYNKVLVPDDEVFVVTAQDLLDANIIQATE